MQKSTEKILAAHWKHYLTRPFTLFGASLWHKWYDSPTMLKLHRIRIKDALLVEERKNTFAHYMLEPAVRKLYEMAGKLANDRKRLAAAFVHAQKLNKTAEDVLAGIRSFKNFKNGVDFVTKLGQYSAQTPRIALMFGKIEDKALTRQAEALRSISYYPRVIDEVLIPLAQREFKLSRGAVLNSTIDQLFSGGHEGRASGRIIYTVLGGKEHIERTDNIEPVIKILNPQLDLQTRSFKGTPAYLGTAQGRVRIIDSFNYQTAKFDKGDILVSINSNPSYIVLIRKAAALVTDEGGMGTHAAIISRELKKPCVVGTQIATKVLHDGDRVEVDASRGRVTILSHR